MAVRTGDSLLAGRYHVLRPLGSGGMAAVVLCRDERLGREVAVKRLHAHGSEEDRRRFLREARVGASLNHPNLVSVYDTATDEESVLIAMEYVEGETLADALGRGPLPLDRALSVIEDLASALEHAHAHDVVHRDVKPANVLLREDGTAKLADLGIAVAGDTTRITRSGTVLGTAAYMAPEQLDGRPVGPAADVYALSAVAFEALSGQRAQPGCTPIEVARRVATDSPPDLTRAWPDAPPAAARVLRDGMARDPAERPSPARLVERLERALAGDPATAVLPGPLPPRTRPGRRILAVAALGAAALTLAGIVALGGGDSPDERRAEATAPSATPDREPTARNARPGPKAALPQGRPAPAREAAGGPSLNDQGYALMRAGRFDDAVPVLRRAVAAFPEGTDDVRYAYALFNLGSALRQAGRPGEAIPILERRLRIPNQTDTVRHELAMARADAGARGPAPREGKGKKNGQKRGGKRRDG